ncbi:phospholipase [Lithospermum erythrorhizon]|uniref:Phospholipase n=1 Tax=Lithospermum erythrorhizon TaxID=34254 RepID=A0AAV3RUL5_LITER
MDTKTNNVKYEEEFIRNSRTMRLFTCRWLPGHCEPKALIFLCHGYAMECSVSLKGTGTRLAKAGFAVYGIDYEGHGKSSGLQGYVRSFDDLVTDCSEHFTKISEMKENKNKLRILMGESMGGAVVLLLHRKKPTFWDGGILVAPMVKIADDLKPHPVAISILTKLTSVIPTWKIVPIPDVVDAAFRRPEIREEIRNNEYCYKGRPRLQTGHQMLTISLDLEKRLNEVKLPFIVIHGEQDTVTDPSCSKLLYDSAASTDKTIKLYPGMWHDLLYGELIENIDIVFSDIIRWLQVKVAACRQFKDGEGPKGAP